MLKHLLRQNSAKYNGMKQIYQIIHRNGPITKAKLIEFSQMKQTTVTRHLEQLVRDKVIKIGQYEESSGGRPPALYEIEPNAAFIIGIDLSRTTSTLSVVNMSFKKLDSYTFDMTDVHTPSYTIELIKRKMDQLLNRNHITDENFLGIGIGSVGPLDREEGVILDPESFIADGWRNVHIIEALRTWEEDIILLENGANTATLYEYIHANYQDQTILYNISGWGLRCGVLSNGEILKNKTGDASSFGKMILDVTERKNLTSFISYEQLLKETNKQHMLENKPSFLSTSIDKKEQMKLFIKEVTNNNPVAQDVLLRSAITYGVGIANMINILHPDKVVLSSELISTFPNYYEKIVESTREHIYRVERQPVQFKKADPKENAISIGAAVMVFQSYFL